jgi:hypothetical protein
MGRAPAASSRRKMPLASPRRLFFHDGVKPGRSLLEAGAPSTLIRLDFAADEFRAE